MRIISVITALALTQTAFLSAQQSGNYSLTKDPLYQESLEALTDHLPLIASQKLTSLIKQKSDSLTAEQHLELIFLLAEAQVRANKPQKAIQSLSHKLIADNPDAVFWRGHALAATGRYNEAIDTFEKADPKSKNYQLGQLKRANLAIAIGDIDKALNILKQAIQKSKTVSPQTYLSLANLYIAKEEPLNATEALDEAQPTDPINKRAKQMMLAQVDLISKKYDSAVTAFEQILSEQNLQSNVLNFAALKLADALYANGKEQDAINTLIEYLGKQPGQFIGPMFTRFSQWLPKDTPITDSNIMLLMDWASIDSKEIDNTALPLNDSASDLSAFAHYHYAKFLSNKSETSNKTKAVQEFEKLRLKYPTHILSGTSLSDSASTLLTLGRVEETKEILKTIQDLTTPIAPHAKQQAGLLLGKLNLDDKNYSEAAKAYQALLEFTNDDIKTVATMNAAYSYLAADDEEGFSNLLSITQDTKTQQNLKLEQALWSARNEKTNARTALHDFVLKHPEHPRINEAYLSLALHCLSINPVDKNLSNLIIPEIKQATLNEDQKVDLSYLKYRDAITQKDYTSAVTITKRFLDRFPSHPRAPEFTLHQGQSLYHNGQHNAARQLLLGMAKNYPEHPLKDFAEYYAAMSAKLEGTPQSAEEAILLFSQISKSESNLAEEARLQLTRLYTNTNQPNLAVEVLNPIYTKQKKNSKDLNLSLELANAYQALGDTDNEYFQSALNVYNELSTQFADNAQIVNEIKYNKALLLQHMEQDEKALEIYYSVINIDIKKQPITEWNYYFRCGFRAITMLEEMKNPKAAIAIAKKLAESEGNRSEDAAKKARDLEMKYMIWQE